MCHKVSEHTSLGWIINLYYWDLVSCIILGWTWISIYYNFFFFSGPTRHWKWNLWHRLICFVGNGSLYWGGCNTRFHYISCLKQSQTELWVYPTCKRDDWERTFAQLPELLGCPSFLRYLSGFCSQPRYNLQKEYHNSHWGKILAIYVSQNLKENCNKYVHCRSLELGKISSFVNWKCSSTQGSILSWPTIKF